MVRRVASLIDSLLVRGLEASLVTADMRRPLHRWRRGCCLCAAYETLACGHDTVSIHHYVDGGFGSSPSGRRHMKPGGARTRKALEGRAVADAARHRLAVAAGRDQRLPALDAADRHVIDEPGARIAALRARLVLRHHDDAVADRLAAAAGRHEAHGAGADIGL